MAQAAGLRPGASSRVSASTPADRRRISPSPSIILSWTRRGCCPACRRRFPVESAIKGAFIGFDDKTGPGDFYRALLEASAFEVEGWLRAARRLAPGVTLDSVVNVGGGAQNALWNQIKTDVTGLPFRTARDEVNAARGAALAAGIAAGAIDRTRHGWFAPAYLGARTSVPDAATYATYRPLAETYDELVEQLLPVFRKLKILRQPH